MLACTVRFVKLIYDGNYLEVEGDYAEKQEFQNFCRMFTVYRIKSSPGI
jgi:hypothetical protein